MNRKNRKNPRGPRRASSPKERDTAAHGALRVFPFRRGIPTKHARVITEQTEPG